ncbi:MAG: ATP-binding cassette domain-containing protein [Chitinophagaceae bacterium]
MSIVVHDISKYFEQQIAVNHISFTINKNEIVGFLGPNGAGKSSTMKMITGFWQPCTGSIDVCNISTQKNSILVKKKIGYLPEHNPLYLDMFVKEYLFFIATSYAISHPIDAVNNIVKQTGLQIEKHKKIGQLSKGYRQRVGLAAALIHNPEVLILDEPTSGLDPNQIIEIRQLIKHIAQNKTVLFSTHIMQEVESLCERVIIINQGKIVANENLHHLKNSFKNTHTLTLSSKKEIDLYSLQKDFPSEKIIAIDKYTIDIRTSNSEKLVQWFIKNDYPIQSLQQKSSGIEEIFKTLTSV